MNNYFRVNINIIISILICLLLLCHLSNYNKKNYFEILNFNNHKPELFESTDSITYINPNYCLSKNCSGVIEGTFGSNNWIAQERVSLGYIRFKLSQRRVFTFKQTKYRPGVQTWISKAGGYCGDAGGRRSIQKSSNSNEDIS